MQYTRGCSSSCHEFIVLGCLLKGTLKWLIVHHSSICLYASKDWNFPSFETSVIVLNKTIFICFSSFLYGIAHVFCRPPGCCLCFMIMTQQESYSMLQQHTLVTGIFSLRLTHRFWGQRISFVVSETIALNTSYSSRFSQTLYDPRGHFLFPPT